MSRITPQDLHKHMQVYSEDRTELGHIIEIYEDSFEVHKHLLGKHIYLTYSTVAAVEGEQVRLNITADEAEKPSWQKRPDYENHPGDPTQLFYDRGHGIHDPLDETNPDKG
jgi:hypothetical protein